jgi:hypothetical protein
VNVSREALACHTDSVVEDFVVVVDPDFVSAVVDVLLEQGWVVDLGLVVDPVVVVAAAA